MAEKGGTQAAVQQTVATQNGGPIFRFCFPQVSTLVAEISSHHRRAVLSTPSARWLCRAEAWAGWAFQQGPSPSPREQASPARGAAGLRRAVRRQGSSRGWKAGLGSLSVPCSRADPAPSGSLSGFSTCRTRKAASYQVAELREGSPGRTGSQAKHHLIREPLAEEGLSWSSWSVISTNRPPVLAWPQEPPLWWCRPVCNPALGRYSRLLAQGCPGYTVSLRTTWAK